MEKNEPQFKIAGRAKDLIDTRGRKELIGARKRKREPSSGTTGEESPSSTPDWSARVRSSDSALAKIFRPDKIPQRQFNSLRSLLIQKEKSIFEQESTIKEHCSRIESLKDDLEAAKTRIAQDQDHVTQRDEDIARLTKNLIEVIYDKNFEIVRNQELVSANNAHEDLFRAGRTVLSATREEIDRLTKENAQLCSLIAYKDTVIASLGAENLRLSLGLGDDRAPGANVPQTECSTDKFKALQKDIAEKGKTIQSLKANIDSLEKKNHDLEAKIAELRSRKFEVEKEMMAGRERAAESTTMLDDQAVLMQKLIEGNVALLQVHGKGVK